MIKWFRKKQAQGHVDADSFKETIQEEENGKEATPEFADDDSSSRTGVFARFRKGLAKTRHQLGEGVGRLLLGKKEIPPEILEELETLLLSADFGIETTEKILTHLSERLARKQLSDGQAVYEALKAELIKLLTFDAPPLALDSGFPFILLMVGVNGAGKTTTIGKLARKYQQEGKKVMLAAGDTFRAAAVEQLKVWGERNGIPVIAQQTGADSASVIFDAVQAAKARHMDILIADTAGRLHTQGNLMNELKKIKRVIQKIDPSAPHETMLVLDASVGQNALNQARQFNQDIAISGITMTKLDGTAKGGILFAIANELRIPFRYLGVGEGIEDLRPFDAAQFVSAIFENDYIQSSQ
ncbi:signal recognition particle-docking protein FtsY [Legionella israelensis]|uniref:Signal recognition particle receptor FtsY n=1 Tax=Legionella israelensis TaxID=454 RepID=A0A0W0V459_9GAMM|nr:signal recognition particle-docking protein FtsY [Legionella israelensis]KTD14473.1 cell division membrane protein FtsY [Legionella israelensis]QBS09317.1 signal recognition particle-docking protein FtsY [Legionella israelensis]SCX89647.1 fused signal recognition particle receptor [Legionella israelensis DSM 19235]STX60212.1 cell division membrane protein FtsY [Legionella israelensis]